MGTPLVALSGGVDSSVAAAAVHEAGHRAIAVTMRTFCYGSVESGAKSCCGLEGVADARAVALALGMPHHVVDVSGEFGESVIEDFVAEYAAGRTPNPCIRCNTFVKFPALLARFRALGVDRMATGHHARILRREGRARLARGLDTAKDQSYVLWGLPGDLLERLVFPVGELTKGEVRERARALGLPTAEKPESQEICFVPDGGHAEFVADRRPEAMRPGVIVDDGGRELGTHRGIAAYTVGQRRGLGLAHPVPLYVAGIDAKENRILVAEEAALPVDRCRIDQLNLHEELGAGEWIEGLEGQFRAHQACTPVAVRLGDDGLSAELRLLEVRRSVAPGQSAVLYRGDEVVLGGVVGATRRAAARGGS